MPCIPERYAEVIRILRDTLVECGGRPLYEPEDFGLNEFYPSRSGRVELRMDYGSVNELYTPEGSIQPYGSHCCASDPTFLDKLIERLQLEVKTPQRNDKDVDYLTYQLSASGPTFFVNHQSSTMPIINDDEKLTVEQFHAFMDAVHRCQQLSASWRAGQTMYNVLWQLHPTQANVIRGTAVDPFYRNDLIAPFLTELLTPEALAECSPNFLRGCR